jgi:hypothetical protein
VLEPEAAPEVAPAPSSEDSEPESAAEPATEPATPASLAAASAPEPELIQVTELVSYMREADGEIQCTYVGFSNKGKAQSWGEWLTSSTVAIASRFEVKPATKLPFKHELHVWGLNLNQVNKLAEQDFSKTPKAGFSASGMVSKTRSTHILLEEIEPGDTVASLLTPSWTYKVKEVKPDGTLICNRTVGEQTFTVEKNGREVRLVEKAKEPQAVEELQAESQRPENQLETALPTGESEEPTVEESTTASISDVSEDQDDTPEVRPELAVADREANQSISEDVPEATIDHCLNGRVTGNEISHASPKAGGSYTQPTQSTAVIPALVTPQLENLEPGDLVGSLLVPGWTYRVVEVRPNGQLNCTRLLSSGESFNVDLDINGVYLVEKAAYVAPEPEPEPELLANAPINERHSQAAQSESPEEEPTAAQLEEPMTQELLAEFIRAAWSWEEIEAITASNEQYKKAAWSLLTQKEKDQVLALKLESQQKEKPTPEPEPPSTQSAMDDFQEGDEVEVISTRHGEERVGEVGIVKVVNNHGLTVESRDGNLTYWYPEELKLLSQS